MPLYSQHTLGAAGAGDVGEIERVDRATRRKRKKRALEEEYRRDPDLGRRAKDLRRAYSWLPPEAVQRLARDGREVDDPVVQSIADAAARVQAKTGRRARPGERNRGNPNPAEARRLPGTAPLRPGTGGDILGDINDAISSVNPFDNDKYGGGTMSGETLRRASDEYLPEEVSAPIRGVSRGFMLGAQVPLDLVHGGIRDAANRIDQLANGRAPTVIGQGASDPFDLRGGGGRVPLWEQSQGLQAAADAIQGKPVDVGSGWFPDPESRTGRAAAEAAREAAPNIGPHAFTLGRYVANQVFDPDTVPFDILSGAVDAVVAVKADPTNPVFDLYTATRRTGRTFAAAGMTEEGGFALAAAKRADDAIAAAKRNPDDLDLAARAREAALTEREASDAAIAAARRDAGAFEGHRPWVSPRTAQQWIVTKGKPVVDWSVKNTDPYESWLAFGKKGPREMHVGLAQAADDGEVMRVLGRHLGTDIRDLPSTGRLPGTGRSTLIYEPLDNQRWAQMAPKEAAINPSRPADALEEADRYARNAGMSKEARKAAVTPFFTAQSYDDYYEATTGLLEQVRRQLIDDGIPESAADELTTFTAQRNAALRKYGIDDVSGENLDQPFALVNGEGIASPSPHLPTEMLSHGIPLPDFRAVRRATRTIGGDVMRLRGTAQTQTRMAAGLISDEDLAARVGRAADGPAFGAVSPHGRIVQHTKRGPENPLSVVRAESERLDRLAGEAKALGDQEASRLLSSASRTMRVSAGRDWTKAAAGGALESFGDLWRRAKLFRPAWGIRVTGEEQARMWAYGAVGAFDHPMQALGIVAGANPDSRLARLLSRSADQIDRLPGVSGARPALVADVTGAQLSTSDELAEAMNESFGILYTDAIQRGGLRGPSTDMWVTAERGADHYWQGVAEEAARLHMDPVAKKVAGMSRDEARAYFRGEGSDLWETVARPGRTARAASGAEPKAIESMTDAERESMLDWYLDTVDARIEGIAQHDPRIRQAIATGSIDDVPLKVSDGRIDANLPGTLENLDGYSGPMKVRIREQVVHPRAGHRMEALSQTFDSLMWNLMPRPSNWLSRSPYFRQNYWDRVDELGAAMDPRDLAKAVDSGKRAAASAGWDTPEGLTRLAARKGTPGGLSVKEVDRLAKAHALAKTQETLYDLSERGQLFDALRQIFPFGEAWKEVLSRWGRAVWENPKVVHRVDQGLTSAREAGIITKDPTTGQEVILYPGAEWITDKILGVPVPLSGSVQGVNIASAGLPGVGPAVSLPLPYLAKSLGWNLDDPGITRDLMEAIYPYGRNDSGRPDRDVLDQLLPTWAARSGKAFENWISGGEVTDASTRSTINYFLNYLASTGDYDLHGADAAEETKRMIDDATSKARWFQIIRGGASALAPSAPIPKYLMRDGDNKLVEMQVVREKYQKIAADPDRGEDEAFAWLIDTYGVDSFLTAQAFTRTNGLNLPRTRKQADFLVGREYLRDLYPETYGLILPPDDPKDFDITEYFAQVRRGERENLTAKERVELANSRLASYIYDRAADRVGANPSDEDQGRLDRLERALTEEYPGYQAHGFDYRRTPRRIQEITRMVNDERVNADPALRDTAETVRTYLAARDRIIAAQGDRGLSAKQGVSKAKGAADLRKALREVGDVLRDRDKRFGFYWSYVFGREVQEVT